VTDLGGPADKGKRASSANSSLKPADLSAVGVTSSELPESGKYRGYVGMLANSRSRISEAVQWN
jgi:hypothetical protein